MDANATILNIIRALPDREVRGKKRLQKLAYLLKEAGLPTDAEFSLWDYGPYSTEISRASSILASLGAIQEREVSLDFPRRFVTVYSIGADDEESQLSEELKMFLRRFDQFTTIELEIAGTIRLFEKESSSFEEAVSKTCAMKPTKTQPQILARAREVLDILKQG